MTHRVWLLVALLTLGGCSILRPSKPGQGPPGTTPSMKLPPGVPSPPRDLASIPDAVPREEPLSRYGNPESYVVFGRRYRTLKSAKGFVERGNASWYGPGFHGERTSSGEPFDMYAMTAAHKTLPIPSYVRVTNLDNDRSIVVKINDRGPFVDKRIIDLSYTAAWKLDMLRTGTAPVEVRVIDPKDRSGFFARRGAAPAPTTPTAPTTQAEPGPRRWVASAMPSPQALGKALNTPLDKPLEKALGGNFLQLGAFGLRDNAEALLQRVRDAGIGEASIRETLRGDRQWFRVQIGPFNDAETAERMLERLREIGIVEVRVVTE